MLTTIRFSHFAQGSIEWLEKGVLLKSLVTQLKRFAQDVAKGTLKAMNFTTIAKNAIIKIAELVCLLVEKFSREL